jgi:hypothetical protein
MSDHPLPDFDSFATALQQTNLPGTRDRRFLSKVYELVSASQNLQTEGQHKAKEVADKYRPIIDKLDAALKDIKDARKFLDDTRKRLEKIFFCGVPSRPPHLFHPSQDPPSKYAPPQDALSDVEDALYRRRQLALGFLHPHFVKKKKGEPDSIGYRSLLENEFEYPLARWGWKPVETWFIEELHSLFSECFTGKTKVPKNQRYRLIQAIFNVAFGEEKTVESIKLHVRRIEERRKKATPVEVDEDRKDVD